MSRAIVELPAEQIAPLARAYDAAIAARRRHSLLLALAVLLCVGLSVWGGEVRPSVFAANASRLGDYFYNHPPRAAPRQPRRRPRRMVLEP